MIKKDIELIKSIMMDNTISDYEKKVLLHSLVFLKDEDLVDVTKQSVIDRLRVVLDEIQDADKTLVVEDRIKREVQILNSILNANLTYEDLVDASFQVDCLCYDNDIKPSNTNTALEYAKKINSKKLMKR